MNFFLLAQLLLNAVSQFGSWSGHAPRLSVCLSAWLPVCLLTSAMCMHGVRNSRTGKRLVPKYPLFSIFPLFFSTTRFQKVYFTVRWLMAVPWSIQQAWKTSFISDLANPSPVRQWADCGGESWWNFDAVLNGFPQASRKWPRRGVCVFVFGCCAEGWESALPILVSVSAFPYWFGSWCNSF